MLVDAYLRLLPTDDMAWALFPVFKQRVEAFIKQYLPETNAAPALADMVKAWTDRPYTTGYWLVFAQGAVVGHFYSWIAESYGRPYVFVYQAHLDEGYQLLGIQNAIMRQMDEWVDALNLVANPRITRGEMSTWRDPAVFSEYIKRTGRGAGKIRSVVEFMVGSSNNQTMV